MFEEERIRGYHKDVCQMQLFGEPHKEIEQFVNQKPIDLHIPDHLQFIDDQYRRAFL